LPKFFFPAVWRWHIRGARERCAQPAKCSRRWQRHLALDSTHCKTQHEWSDSALVIFKLVPVTTRGSHGVYEKLVKEKY